MMSSIEKELVKLSGFEPTREYKTKQDYMAALARVVDQLNEVDFDKLSEPAADWFNAAARAISNKKVIPNFEDEVATSEVQLPEPDKPAEPYEGETVAVKSEAAPEPRLEQPPKKKGPKQQHRAAPPLALELPKTKRLTDDTFQIKYSGRVDKWGFAIGSKSSAAASMFEQGARMKDVKASVGGTYYTILRSLIQRGHKVENEANSLIRITYRKPPGPEPKPKNEDGGDVEA